MRYLGEPLGEQTMAVDLNQMRESVIAGVANSQFLGNCLAETGLSGARRSVEQNQTIAADHIWVDFFPRKQHRSLDEFQQLELQFN